MWEFWVLDLLKMIPKVINFRDQCNSNCFQSQKRMDKVFSDNNLNQLWILKSKLQFFFKALVDIKMYKKFPRFNKEFAYFYDWEFSPGDTAQRFPRVTWKYHQRFRKTLLVSIISLGSKYIHLIVIHKIGWKLKWKSHNELKKKVSQDDKNNSEHQVNCRHKYSIKSWLWKCKR